MTRLERIGNAIPEVAKDIVEPPDSSFQRNPVAVATLGSRDRLCGGGSESGAARRGDRRRQYKVGEGVVEDALAAAALMAMNNVYYRFRHLVGKPSYSQKPARLRMNRLVRPATNKGDFELFCLAVSAIYACETCLRAHEKVVAEGGLAEDAVHDAVRIAATVHASALALEMSPVPAVPAAA